MASDPTRPRHDPDSDPEADTGSSTCVDPRSQLSGRIASLRGFLHAVALRRLDRPEALNGVSDVVQETCVRAHADRKSFRGDSDRALKAWLVGILKHNLLNYARYRRTRRLEFGGFSLQEPDTNGAARDVSASTLTPSGVVSLDEQRTLMNRALQRLDPRDRQVIVWHNHDGLRFEAIGDRLGGSADMARKAWYRALVRLREEFEALSRAS